MRSPLPRLAGLPLRLLHSLAACEPIHPRGSQMNVRLYGRLADLVGQGELVDPAAQSCSIAELRSAIASRYPEAGSEIRSRRVRACVADAIVGDEHRLEAEDTVEFFPLVSGG